jgi:alkanesulfonate monooxygenase SsuD/methylene tetrahydromethanopterin reductase-like flavin-dependent oxidoreductase (luciferase family)
MLLNIPYLLIGTEEEIIDQIEEYRAQLGISYFCVFEHHMEEFASVVAHLSGK